MREVFRRRAPLTALAAIAAFLPAACASFPSPFSRAPEFWAFAAPWDPRSAASIARHAAQLDAVITGWIALDSTTTRPLELYADTAALPSGTRRFALVTSWHGDRFHPATIRALASNATVLGETAGAIAQRLRRGGYEAVVVDFENHTPADFGALLSVLRAVADSARAHGVEDISIAIPATDTAGYPAEPLLRIADRVVVMLYDEHWSRSEPGPIASPQWVRNAIGVRLGEVGPSRLVAALPLYGYRWPRDSAAVTIGWDDAQRDAARGGVLLSREPATYTLRARTPDWDLWIADAALVDTLVKDLRSAGVRRFAFWRLGAEDPAVWQVLKR